MLEQLHVGIGRAKDRPFFNGDIVQAKHPLRVNVIADLKAIRELDAMLQQGDEGVGPAHNCPIPKRT